MHAAGARPHHLSRQRHRRLAEPSRLRPRHRPGGGGAAGFPTLSVAENLDIGRDAAARPRAARREPASACFACFPVLAERPRQAAGTLSGGEQQMLAIGRCLMGAPELIMFDEPSLGLAPDMRAVVLADGPRPQPRGAHLLLVEQNVAVSLKLASARLCAGERPHHAVRDAGRLSWPTIASGRLISACETRKASRHSGNAEALDITRSRCSRAIASGRPT